MTKSLLSLDQFKALHSMDHAGKTMADVESEKILDRHSDYGTMPHQDAYKPEHPAGYNARLHGVIESVGKEGIQEPITVSRFVSHKGEERLSVWDGHHRGVAAIRHGLPEVPVSIHSIEDLTKGRWG